MKTDINTTQVAANSSLSFWRESVSSNLIGVDCITHSNQTLEGRFTSLTNQKFAIARLRAAAHTAARDRTVVRSTATDFYILFIQKQGAMLVQQRDCSFTVNPGDLYFYDANTEHTLLFESDFDHLAIKIPRRYLELRWPLLANTCKHLTTIPSSMIDRALLASANVAIDSVDSSGLPIVVGSIIELLAVKCMQQQDMAAGAAPRSIQKLYQDIIELVEKQFDDSTLNAKSSAEQLHISRRQLDRVLAHHSTTFGQLLINKRLHSAAELLCKPWASRLSIIDVAVSCGFDSHSFLSKKFKQRFKLSPTAFRDQHLDLVSPSTTPDSPRTT